METTGINTDHTSVSTADMKKRAAFEYLKSRAPNEFKLKLSSTICQNVAQDFTDLFRATGDPFTIPVSWSLTKDALLNLLGITSFEGYESITGIRLYAGLNENAQLTLIAVSTEADTHNTAINNDLTIDDDYPYYDYADPCPSHCSTVGNLRLMSTDPVRMVFSRVKEES
ncbi:hypothetical protein F0919_10980 [Taibaiella lutea]|uniref:Uncharacterized protein n=1 Tax=Taibaiella lutea TaxID=2608001 RepID=A0A5M6CJ98_9BACT|nr:hypothetical protein [Taibaiella lutea]KAA5535107.1 hypothetical protein F0919_10980 [Taibaiella lutea]